MRHPNIEYTHAEDSDHTCDNSQKFNKIYKHTQLFTLSPPERNSTMNYFDKIDFKNVNFNYFEFRIVPLQTFHPLKL